MLLYKAYTVIIVCCISIAVSEAEDSPVTVQIKHRLATDDNITVTLTNACNSTLTYTTKPIFPRHHENLTIETNEACSIWNIDITLSHDITKFLQLYETDTHIKLVIYGNLSNPMIWTDHLPRKRAPPLEYGQASLLVENNDMMSILIKEHSSNCYKCDPVNVSLVHPTETVHIVVNIQHELIYQFYINDHLLCNISTYGFNEHSIEYIALSSSDGNCTYEIKDNGENAYLPILYVAIVLIGAFVIWNSGMCVYNVAKNKGILHCKRVDRDIDKDLGNPDTMTNQSYKIVNNSDEHTPLLNTNNVQVAAVSKSRRLKSLDAVRGLSLVVMIFVNYGGGGYWFFNHSTWNGITVADLVFPWFVWIMGVSIVLSFQRRSKDSMWSRLYQIIRRTVILMCLGLFLNNDSLVVPWFLDIVVRSILASFPIFRPSPFIYNLYRTSLLVMWVGLWVCHGYQLSTWRIPGVLQRFAISYFVVAMVEFLTLPVYNKFKLKWSVTLFKDITSNWIQWIVIAILELIWILVTFKLPVPGCPLGYLGPGGIAEHGKYSNCTGGAAGYIDIKILSNNHIYGHPTCRSVYQTGSYDPEGILGSINSIVICFLGVQAGRIFVYHKQNGPRIIRLIIWSVVLGMAGIALCEAKQNEGFIPLNKNLWSLSFILVTAAMGFILLTLFYILIDMFPRYPVWNGAPFIYPGMNSILVYVGSELLEGMFPFGWYGMKTSHFEFLASNIISVGLWTAIAYYWFTINFFVKI